jgi:hypothetical protein
VVTAPFTIGKDRHYVSPTALRIGIEQLVYATMLYETSIQDVNYDELQQVVLHTRSIIPAPMSCGSCVSGHRDFVVPTSVPSCSQHSCSTTRGSESGSSSTI